MEITKATKYTIILEESEILQLQGILVNYETLLNDKHGKPIIEDIPIASDKYNYVFNEEILNLITNTMD